jgi:hypothetical protein
MRTLSVARRSLFVLLCAGSAGVAYGQAWLPPKGEGSVSFTYSGGSVDTHIFSIPVDDGSGNLSRDQDLGQIDSKTAVLGFTYGIVERFAFSADVAYLEARYEGTFPENPEIDNGDWNESIQDFRIMFRYQAYRGPVVITPFAGAVIPTMEYEHFGHAAVGRNLHEYPIGVSFGIPFGHKAWGYALANFAYSFVEEIEGISTNRQNAALEFGFFPAHNLVLRVGGGWQDTLGGIDWATDIQTTEDFHVHDVASDSSFWAASAGVAWSISAQVDVYANVNWIMSGSNTHNLETLTAGVAWNFGKDLGRARKVGTKYGPPKTQ